MHAFRKQAQKGFTLIELIITIVIIGILAAVAIPKFVSLNGDAQAGVANGVGAAIASATSVNYSKSLVPGATVCVAGAACANGYYSIPDCATLATNAPFMADIPTGYAVGGTATLTAGVAGAGCTVTYGTGGTSSVAFNAYGA
jgi:MSHA pilin protein MshA